MDLHWSISFCNLITTCICFLIVLENIICFSRASPLELEIHYDGKTCDGDIVNHACAEPKDEGSPCRLISLKRVQTFRSLNDNSQDIIFKEGLLFNEAVSDRYLRAFAYDEELLYQEAVKLCGSANSWSFPVLIDNDITSSIQVETVDQVDSFLNQALLNSVSEDKWGQIWSNSPSPPSLEVLPLTRSGSPSNRVDLVFFSDGYTINEREKFFADAARLSADIADNQTFSSVKPLLNIWAAFSASAESGVGTYGQPKNTTYGLYRDGSELRGVYYSRPDIAHAACFFMGVQCDYPILLGNDPLYGGLGGRFTVVTSSVDNGALVLRHELGHSVIDVGEEYDGGTEYFGVNADLNLSSSISWSHWLTDDPKSIRSERSNMPLQAYPWTFLNISDPWEVVFGSSGDYSRYLVRFSLSGIPEKDHLKVLLDDDDLDWSPRMNIGLDRWHYDIYRDKPLTGGEHKLGFVLGPNAVEGSAQICSVEVLEFGNSSEFNNVAGYVGAFPTYSERNETSFRPTNEGCLMRQVTTPNLCNICLEGLWLHLLARVNLIDDLVVESYTNENGDKGHSIHAELIPFLRSKKYESTTVKEGYAIMWIRDGHELSDLANQTSIDVGTRTGRYEVRVRFFTEEIRKDESDYTSASGTVVITGSSVTISK